MASKRRKKSAVVQGPSDPDQVVEGGGGVASIMGGGTIPGNLGTNRPDTTVGIPSSGELSLYPWYDFPDPYFPGSAPRSPYLPGSIPRKKPPQRGLQITPGIPVGKIPPRLVPPTQITTMPNGPYDFPDPYIPRPTRPRQTTPGIPRGVDPSEKLPTRPRKPKIKKPKGRSGGSGGSTKGAE